MELFNLRCASAGVMVKRTVKDVEGIFLFKIRPDQINHGDQFLMDDPYGRDLGGNGYIESFLSANYEVRRRFMASRQDSSPPSLDAQTGYEFVEAIDPDDRRRYRYTASIEEPWKTNSRILKGTYTVVLHRKPASEPGARYGVTYDDISTEEDRSHWIAGSSLKVIDLETKEVIAERIGYMLDVGQGNTGSGGGRSPWLIAAENACPAFPGKHAYQIEQTDRFVEKVLVPARRSSATH